PAPADTLMRQQITRVLGRTVPREVLGRGDCNLTQIGTQPDCHHVPLNHLADANRYVISTGHYINDLVVDCYVENDVWIRIVEGSQQWPDELVGRGPEAVNSHQPRGLLP